MRAGYWPFARPARSTFHMLASCFGAHVHAHLYVSIAFRHYVNYFQDVRAFTLAGGRGHLALAWPSCILLILYSLKSESNFKENS